MRTDLYYVTEGAFLCLFCVLFYLWRHRQTASASFRTREVVILGQAGKIVGYALEKVLAPAQELAELERTVRI
jgi:hypothetical protein